MSENEMIKEIYLLTPMQEGMLFHKLLGKDKNAYFEQSSFRISGILEVELFEKSINKLIERYDVLRTIFIYEHQKRTRQVVLKEAKVKICFENISDLTSSEKTVFINGFKEKDKNKGFNLSKEISIRASIIKIDEENYIFILSFHHIILDGWSIPIILNELMYIYNALKKNMPLKLRKVNEYSNYIKWLEKQDKNEALVYWKKYLDGYEQQAQVSQIDKSFKDNKYINSEIKFSIGRELTDKLKDIAGKNKITVNTIFQTVWGILLQRYNNVEDVVFGSVVSGRPAEIDGIENMVGLFINAVPVRIKSTVDKTFIELIKEVHDCSSASKKYEYVSLAKIQSSTSLKQQLIDNMLVFENYPVAKYNNKSELKMELVEAIEQTNYNFNIIAGITDELFVKLNFNACIYEKQYVNMIAGHIKQIIKEVVENPEIKISEMEIISEEEKRKILLDFNDTKTEYPKHKTIHELFEEQVEKSPDNIAVVYENKELTYRELNEKSNSLARVLREKGVIAGSIVGIMVDRSLEMIIGIMGILKAGGAYLPIDPEYPQERIEYMLGDSKTKILLTQYHLMDNVKFEGIIVNLEDEELYKGSKGNFEKVNSSKDLAYIIYTSGSTGRPKGSKVMHYNVNRVVKNTNYINITEEDIMLQLSNYAFDGSVFDIYGALLNGAKLILIKKETVTDISKLGYILINRKISIFFITTALFNTLVDNNIECFRCIRKVLFGGEKISISHARKALEYMGPNKIIHVYGPTESTVFTTYYDINDINENIPIGSPIANTKIYIIEKNDVLSAIGIPAEICIAGDGLIDGYLNNEELTAEKFRENPFVAGERMFSTGDLGRWLPNGNIEFIGRIDNQVKIRGFRIELGEIENQLLKREWIKEAVVVDREDKQGNKYLCAYLVGGKEMTIQELRGYLSKKLPDYMIPAYFMQIEKMPLTLNGKLDRKALPEPDGKINTGVEYAAPKNEIEKKLVKVWTEVLSVEKIGIDDDFFTLGGDSIKAIQVCARLSRYNLKITVSELFANLTIRELSLNANQENKQINQTAIEGKVELTAIQRWFFKQEFTNMHHWNQSFMMYSKEGFNEKIINKVFSKIVKHHDALRIVIKEEGDKIIQYNKGTEDKLFDLSVMDLSNKESYQVEIEKEAIKIQSSIDLFDGPLVKLGLFKTKDGDHLLIAIHHLVVDGISWRVLFEDISTGYRQAINKEEIELPSKTHSFKEWSENIINYAKSSKLLEEIKYWSKIENTKVGEICKDYEITNNKVYNSNSIEMKISKENTKNLIKDTKKAYNTEINDILLASLGLAIKNWTGENKVLVNLEGHGREEIMPNMNITRTVGWFTSAYPVILDCEKSDDIGYYIKLVKDDLRKIPSRGVGYNILKYITPKEYINDLEFKLKPHISFNYLGQFDNDINQGVFNMSSISTGDSISKESERLYDININGMVVNEELSLNFEYNKDEYDKSTIIEFVKNYKEALLDVIKHCTEKENTEMTPSDFDYKEVSIEELQDMKLTIGSLFNEI